jgi:hypothetical protein
MHIAMATHFPHLNGENAVSGVLQWDELSGIVELEARTGQYVHPPPA